MTSNSILLILNIIINNNININNMNLCNHVLWKRGHQLGGFLGPCNKSRNHKIIFLAIYSYKSIYSIINNNNNIFINYQY